MLHKFPSTAVAGGWAWGLSGLPCVAGEANQPEGVPEMNCRQLWRKRRCLPQGPADPLPQAGRERRRPPSPSRLLAGELGDGGQAPATPALGQ